MPGKKVQLPVVGGIRKVVFVQDNAQAAVNPGTTIAEFANQTVTLAQLKTALGITPQKGTGGAPAAASLVLGPGLTGGGPLVGAVALNLGPPVVIYDDQLLPDDSVSPAGGGGGSSTLAGLSDVSIHTPIAGQVLEYSGTKWANANIAGAVAPPQVIQSQFLRWDSGGGSPTTTNITLATAPTPGNVLVAVTTGFDTTSNNYLTIPAGFNRVAYFNVNNSEGIAVAVRVVQAGDGTTYAFGGGNGGDNIGLWEFSGVISVTAFQAGTTSSGTVLTVADLQSALNSYNIGLVETDAVNGYSSISGGALLFDGTSTLSGSSNHPAVYFQGPSAMGNVAVTYTGTSFTFPIAASVVVQGPTGIAVVTTPTSPPSVLMDDQLFADDIVAPASSTTAVTNVTTQKTTVLLDDQLFPDDIVPQPAPTPITVTVVQTAVVSDDQLFADDIVAPASATTTISNVTTQNTTVLLDDQLFPDDIVVASPAFAQAVAAAIATPVLMDDQLFSDEAVLPAPTSAQAAGADSQIQYNTSGFLSASYKLVFNATSGALTVSQGTATVASANGSPGMLLTAADGSAAIYQLQTFRNGATTQSTFHGLTARGTAASPSALMSTDNIFRLSCLGYNGTAWYLSSSINQQAAENWNSTSGGTRITFGVTANTTISMTTALTIENDAGLFTNGATGSSKGSGTINATGLYINGAATAPNSMAFASVTVPGGNTVANTTTATAFTSSYTIAANTLVLGSVVRVTLRGVYSTAVAPPTLTIALKVGSTTVLTTGAITTVGSLTNVGWSYEALLIVQTSGSSGTLEAQGTSILQTALTSGSVLPLENTSAFTVNTTTSQAITAVVTWGTASTSDTITLRQMAVWVETAASTA